MAKTIHTREKPERMIDWLPVRIITVLVASLIVAQACIILTRLLGKG